MVELDMSADQVENLPENERKSSDKSESYMKSHNKSSDPPQ